MRSGSLVRQRGVAVITALLLTTLAITIVASLFWQQQVQVRSIENQRLQLQKQWILRGAIDWARLILREDARYTTVDSLDEPWAVPLAETRLDQYVENGKTDADASDAAVSGSIVDAQSRYNLTNLCPNGNLNIKEVAVFARLLSNMQLNPGLAQATATMMMAAAQANPQVPASSDKQAPASSSNNARPMNFEQVNDLLAVPGFSVDAIDKLKDVVIVLPRATPVNINTASAEVLAARISTFSLSDAATLIAARKTASFRDVNDLKQRLPGKQINETQAELSSYTNFFLVNGQVRLSRAGLDVQALIERFGSPVRPETKLIWIREN
jgi:general secretion pathway protein K